MSAKSTCGGAALSRWPRGRFGERRWTPWLGASLFVLSALPLACSAPAVGRTGVLSAQEIAPCEEYTVSGICPRAPQLNTGPERSEALPPESAVTTEQRHLLLREPLTSLSASVRAPTQPALAPPSRRPLPPRPRF